MGEVTPAEFSWAFTPATPQTGLVDFLNLTVKDGRLRVIARQGNEGLNGKRVQFDLPIEAFHDLREAMTAARPVDDDVVAICACEQPRVRTLARSGRRQCLNCHKPPPDCEKHGALFISPGICPFCDEEARAAITALSGRLPITPRGDRD